MIAFSSRPVKQAVLAELRSPLEAAVGALRAMHRWAARRAPFGDKLDAVALDGAGRVLLVEAKAGSDTTACGWTPAQVTMYLALFRRWADQERTDAIDVLRGLRDQRARLGLLPHAVAGFDPAVPLALTPVIALSEPIRNPAEPVAGELMVRPR